MEGWKHPGHGMDYFSYHIVHSENTSTAVNVYCWPNIRNWDWFTVTMLDCLKVVFRFSLTPHLIYQNHRLYIKHGLWRVIVKPVVWQPSPSWQCLTLLNSCLIQKWAKRWIVGGAEARQMKPVYWQLAVSCVASHRDSPHIQLSLKGKPETKTVVHTRL